MIRVLAWTFAILALVDHVVYHGTYTEIAGRMLTDIVARV
jgi:hypothetical protein